MKLTAAVVREQGHRFVIILVRDSVIHHPTLRSELLGFGRQEFRCGAVLMGQEHHQTYGPHELVNRLRSVRFDQIPWQEFSISR